MYYGNVTENGTAGMMVMTMTAIDYDDLEEGTNAKLKYSIEKNVIDENTGTPIFEIEEDTGVIFVPSMSACGLTISSWLGYT